MTVSAAGLAAPASGGPLHDVAFADSAAGLVEVALPFAREGLAAGDPVVVVTGEPVADALRAALGQPPGLTFLDQRDVYGRRTPATLTAFRKLVAGAELPPGRRLRVIAEIAGGPGDRDWLEWQRYEAVVEHALAGCPVWFLCLQDTGELPAQVVRWAHCTHRHVHAARGRRPNPEFQAAEQLLAQLPVPTEPLQAAPPLLSADGVTRPGAVRHALAPLLAGLDRSPDATDDLLLAIDELVTNALVHGRPPADVRVWADGGTVVCTVSDGGTGPGDPFAGYGPAHGEDLSRGGMGLWLARQLCDHVDIWTDERGVTVRVTTELPAR
ncbi:anti-sigma factor RsbA family regulatory protein [Modestobacter roseus]|uniref:anti-sigma factor RsbA family regulatory protein n=1 Tax=Modestobacter roseus TaxID=1181884 RepID=UPI0034DFDCB0